VSLNDNLRSETLFIYTIFILNFPRSQGEKLLPPHPSPLPAWGRGRGLPSLRFGAPFSVGSKLKDLRKKKADLGWYGEDLG
jgi:hypothetical protein